MHRSHAPGGPSCAHEELAQLAGELLTVSVAGEDVQRLRALQNSERCIALRLLHRSQGMVQRKHTLTAMHSD
jgi:hypothetical protein